MRRVTSEPRPNWQATVESQGFHFHSAECVPYWDESAYYEFTAAEIDEIEKATYALNELCLKAVEHAVSNKLLDRFDVPPQFVPWLEQSWENDSLTMYGRYDFAYDGRGPVKLLEYNADTPTALLEAAVIQWHWLQDKFPGGDQFNSIHERLIEFWKTLSPPCEGPVHCLSLGDHLEDFMTANYVRDTAEQAGLKSIYLPIERVGWNSARRCFVDEDEGLLRTVFKLYPWEWMLDEEFGQHLPQARVRWFEAPWKLILSHKEILVLLWEMFPECPYLLRAGREPWNQTYAQKPARGREGANVRIVVNGSVAAESDGEYGDGRFIYQDVKAIAPFDGNYPILGSWLVNGYACGIGIREDHSPITRNTSRFVPHRFTKTG